MHNEKNKNSRIRILKSKIKLIKERFAGTGMPVICDSLRLWAPSRIDAWEMRLLHPAFCISPKVPENLIIEAPQVAARYFANTELGFAGQFLFRLPEASVRGPHGFVVLKEGAFVLEGNWRVDNISKNPIYRKKICDSKSEFREGNWYSTISYFSCSYHHWLWDDLPRLLTALPHLPHDTMFLVPQSSKDYHFDSLIALGINRSRIIQQNSALGIKCENLWFATPLGHSEWAATSPEVATHLGNLLRNHHKLDELGERKIYISRQQARQRRMLNEEEILPILYKHGFQVVFAECLTFSQQVKLFGEANCILGIHGAGLTNMLFAKSGAQVLEIQPDHQDSSRTHYWMMASTLGHNYKCMLGQSILNSDPTKDHDLRVDPNRLEKMISLFK
jgi:hypothetical protein